MRTKKDALTDAVRRSGKGANMLGLRQSSQGRLDLAAAHHVGRSESRRIKKQSVSDCIDGSLLSVHRSRVV